VIVLIDNGGLRIRLTDERREHILEHPEMRDLESALAETMREPAVIVRSKADATGGTKQQQLVGNLCALL
jgi:hypothetical protein